MHPRKPRQGNLVAGGGLGWPRAHRSLGCRVSACIRRSCPFGSVRVFPGALRQLGGARLVSHGTRLSVITVQSLRHDLKLPVLLVWRQGLIARELLYETHTEWQWKIHEQVLREIVFLTRYPSRSRRNRACAIARRIQLNIGVYTVIKVRQKFPVILRNFACAVTFYSRDVCRTFRVWDKKGNMEISWPRTRSGSFAWDRGNIVSRNIALSRG